MPSRPSPSLRDRGLRDFRETVAEVEGLGQATAEAKRAAHATYEAMPAEPEPHYFEPARAPEPPPDQRAAAPTEDAAATLPAMRRQLRRPPHTTTKTSIHAAPAAVVPGHHQARCASAGAGRDCRRGLLAAPRDQHRWWRASVRSRRSPRTRASRLPARKSPTASGSPAKPRRIQPMRRPRRWRRRSCSTMKIRTIRRESAMSAPRSGAPRRCRRARVSRPNSPCAPTSRYPSANCA